MGRRAHRLRRVLALLVGLAVAALVAGVLIYRKMRPEVRRPGEELPEITRRLALDLPADAPEPRFTDATAEAGLAEFVTFVGHRTSQLPEDMGSGAAWGDFDNDGDDDLFLVGAGGSMELPRERWARSSLFENDGGAFREVEGFPEIRLLGMAAAWGDYDDDGWLDLVVTGYGRLLLFHNRRGELAPADAIAAPDGWWSGAAWGDFDNDRDLDLYVCGYVRYERSEGGKASRQYGAEVPYTLNPASYEPEPNLLYQNNGDGTFTEVAEIYGVSNPGGRSLGAIWHDFDDDGWLDLYVANDISDNALFLNRRESFEDAGLAAWVADYRGAMGLAAGDWNRDGDDDLFITHWIAQENALYDSRLVDMARAGAAAGRVGLTFTDLAAPLGLGQPALQAVGWGTEFADFDGDGWLDLVVANGSTLETGDEPKELKRQPAMLFWSRRGEHFHDLASLHPELGAPRVGRGLALSDYDLDGDLDVLLVHLGEGVQLLRNDMQTGNWLELRLRRLGAGEALRFAPGAKVVVHAGDVALRRAVGGGSYLSQSSQLLHFGLGSAESVDRIEVRWPAGEVEEFAGVPANGAWELVEGDPSPRPLATRSGEQAVPGPRDERQRIVDFWSHQRAAMDAMKRDGDLERAIELFRQALALEPDHEDSRYYLANCLAALGRTDEGLAELESLRTLSPSSHRAHKQWGVLRALTARSEADLRAARTALERSLEINPEETGSLLVLGEIDLLLGENGLAEEHLAHACRTNPRAVSGFFLRAYLAWKRGELEASAGLLERAKAARGPEWKPEGAVAEGDVAKRMHAEFTPLTPYWEAWDGSSADLDALFGRLDARLRGGS